MTIPDYLLIGIKDGKMTVISQAGEPVILHAVDILRKKKQKEGKLPYDKYIIVQGSVLNV